MRVLDVLFVAAIVTAFIACPFLLVSWSNYLSHRKENRAFPVKSTIFFAVPVIVGLLSTFTSQSIAQDEVLQLLQSLPANCVLSVDGHKVQNPEEILNTLRAVRDLPAHHSSPTKRITVEISDHSHIVLSLARDSGNPREYWVFYPKYRITASNEIGRIITPLFDAY